MENRKSNEIEKEYNESTNKNILYKIKKWAKDKIRKLYNYFYNEQIKEHKKVMNKQQKEFEEEIMKEKVNFEKEKNKLEKEKEESIKSIEKDKIETIKKNNEKYDDIIANLEAIQNDREKLIEFFNNLTM